MDDNVLAHYGVKGMHWGIRRYQNADGSLTSAGKKRYGSGDGGEKATTKKKRNQMSDEELAKRIQRLERETKLKDLEKKNADDGKAYAKEILKDIGKRVITTAATGAILYGGKAIVSGEFDIGALGNAIFNGGPKKK